MKLEFYPEDNTEKVLAGLAEYEEIWKEDGKKTIKKMEEISGIKFRDNLIKVYVFYDPKRKSNSNFSKIEIKANFSAGLKKLCLIHELAHQLVINEMLKDKNMDIHFVLDLILFDIWESVYGEGFAEEGVRIESGVSTRYKEAWDWALSFDKEKRANKFRELVAV